MMLIHVPNDTYFVRIDSGKIMPLCHKGADGQVRKVVGSWTGHRTGELTGSERCEFTAKTEVQCLLITPQLHYD